MKKEHQVCIKFGLLISPLVIGAIIAIALPRVQDTKRRAEKSLKEAQGIHLTEKQVIEHANEDFRLVNEGKRPEYAELDEDHPTPYDGGKTFYKAEGYQLEIRKKLNRTTKGYEYGPIIHFDNKYINGEAKMMYGIKFYKAEEFKKLFESGLISKKEAIKIAETKFIESYGKRVLEQRPFEAKLDQKIWFIEGTLHCPKDVVCKGGVAEAEISATDGSILKVIHGK